MNNNKKRPLAFWEIGGGDFSREFQPEFEKALRLAADKGVSLKLKATIIIHPPKMQRSNTGPSFREGRIGYEITPPVVSAKSIEYTTIVDDVGMIMSEGKDIAEALQIELFDPADDKTLPFTREGSNS